MHVTFAKCESGWLLVLLPSGAVRTDTSRVTLSRNWSLFLVAAGAFNWLIWPRFALAVWGDQRAWSGEIGQSTPTAFLLVHAVLIVTAVTIGTVILVLGVRGFLAVRRSDHAPSHSLVERT